MPIQEHHGSGFIQELQEMNSKTSLSSNISAILWSAIASEGLCEHYVGRKYHSDRPGKLAANCLVKFCVATPVSDQHSLSLSPAEQEEMNSEASAQLCAGLASQGGQSQCPAYNLHTTSKCQKQWINLKILKVLLQLNSSWVLFISVYYCLIFFLPHQIQVQKTWNKKRGTSSSKYKLSYLQTYLQTTISDIQHNQIICYILILIIIIIIILRSWKVQKLGL